MFESTEKFVLSTLKPEPEPENKDVICYSLYLERNFVFYSLFSNTEVENHWNSRLNDVESLFGWIILNFLMENNALSRIVLNYSINYFIIFFTWLCFLLKLEFSTNKKFEVNFCMLILIFLTLVLTMSFVYSQTCIQWSPSGHKNSGCCW